MALWRTSQAPVFFLLGLSIGVWGCAPEGNFGPSSDQDGANLSIGVDYEPNEVELSVHDLVNDHRDDAGLDLLDFEDTVSAVARLHSEDMATGDAILGHGGFEDRADDVIDEIDTATSVGENVGRVAGTANEDDAAEAMLEFWQGSPDHNENMLHEDWSLAGVGAARAAAGDWYFTQVFVGTE